LSESKYSGKYEILFLFLSKFKISKIFSLTAPLGIHELAILAVYIIKLNFKKDF